MGEKIIKVLVVDDSLFYREYMVGELSRDFYINVVGAASDAYMARDMILKYRPDVMVLDIQMPKMDGIEFLKKLLPQYPLPVIVVSSIGDRVFDALDAGAVDFIEKSKPDNEDDMNDHAREIISKIKVAASSKVSKKKVERLGKCDKEVKVGSKYKLIAIGASTGGTEATSKVIKGFGPEFPPTVIVQHMPPVFTKLYAERLNKVCRCNVKEAENGDILEKGTIYIAPGDYHMRVNKKGSKLKLECFRGDKVNGHCPSVEVLFDSVSKIFSDDIIGVILTGMGRDGAKGLLNIKSKGGYTIGQDSNSSVVYGMPKVAYEIGAVKRQLPLDKIFSEIASKIRRD
ncbi:MAG: chemotaxis response regulator protein-glutamate methylesterase [Firmicutes bacterium]|jgi:two-component system chemotaxis response regulator CheB|nr:chemotaxis response regulator protein-glutamate methylesterase [Bacillota bacterium]